MRRKQIAVCDREASYTCRFTEYANQRKETLFSVHGFTEFSELADFVKQNDVDISLLSLEFAGEAAKNGRLGQVVYLSEEEYLERQPPGPTLYKFQSCDEILRRILDLYAEQAPPGLGQVLRQEKMRLIGIYSPIRRTGGTSFALALGKELSKQRKTLYLNLEEYSGFQSLYPGGEGRSLSELLYFVKQEKGAFACKLAGMTRQLGGLDYISPLRSPVEFRQISREDWQRLLEILGRETGYETVILDLGESVAGLFELLEQCTLVYTPIEEDETARAKLFQYEETLRLLDFEDVLEKTKKLALPRGEELAALVREEGRLWEIR